MFYMLSLRLPENTSCSGDSGDLFVVSSRDNGVTWSAPRSLSGLFDHFEYDWALHGPGPGHGIELDNGRLLLNVLHRRVIVGNTVAQRFYGVASIYSDDHGRTWQATGAVPVSVDYPINEARVGPAQRRFDPDQRAGRVRREPATDRLDQRGPGPDLVARQAGRFDRRVQRRRRRPGPVHRRSAQQ